MTDDSLETNVSPFKTTTEVPAFSPPPAPEPVTAAATSLRAYEDELFGKDAVRIRGQVERGFGSKFKEMTASQARHYAALEKLVHTEKALAHAETALIDADAAHDAALKEVSASEADGSVTSE